MAGAWNQKATGMIGGNSNSNHLESLRVVKLFAFSVSAFRCWRNWHVYNPPLHHEKHRNQFAVLAKGMCKTGPSSWSISRGFFSRIKSDFFKESLRLFQLPNVQYELDGLFGAKQFSGPPGRVSPNVFLKLVVDLAVPTRQSRGQACIPNLIFIAAGIHDISATIFKRFPVISLARLWSQVGRGVNQTSRGGSVRISILITPPLRLFPGVKPGDFPPDFEH